MDARAQYTSFPNLYNTQERKHQRAALRCQWPPALTHDVLLLAWAALLKVYTGIPDPVFSFGGTAIQINVLLDSQTEVEVEGSTEHQYRHTSVTLGKVGL